jgi:hypothetical protein
MPDEAQATTQKQRSTIVNTMRFPDSSGIETIDRYAPSSLYTMCLFHGSFKPNAMLTW